MSSLGYNCKIIDFDGSNQPAGQALTEWLADYFNVDFSSSCVGGDGRDDGSCSVAGSEPCREWGRTWKDIFGCLPPVFLQHSTHSRTVIGVARNEHGEMSLLCMDPARYLRMNEDDDWEVREPKMSPHYPLKTRRESKFDITLSLVSLPCFSEFSYCVAGSSGLS
jgi:hypothetical protein